MKHGALDYKECVGDDLESKWGMPFPRLMKLKPGEDESGGFSHGGWVFPLIDDEGMKLTIDTFSRADAFLLGRGTYDIFAAYWPKVTDPADPIAGPLNSLPKFVASKTKSSFSWNNTTLVRDVVREVTELKKRFQRELQVHGSHGLAQTLIEHNLIDEYRILIFPVVLGTGKRLFGNGALPASLKLIRSSTTRSGVVLAVYRPTGALRTGSFSLEEKAA
jgi:dihydrofolate reductase